MLQLDLTYANHKIYVLMGGGGSVSEFPGGFSRELQERCG